MSEHAESEVTLEQIDSALDDLVKAAKATDLAKAYGGVAIDQGGHVDERGQTSGGYADKGDMGSLDSMMIGKMQSTLVDAGFPADAISAFMAAKKKDEEDEEEGWGAAKAKMKAKQEDEDEEDEEDEGDDEEMGKSWSAFSQDPSIADAIDVSPFLESLVEQTSKQLGGLAKSLRQQSAEQHDVNRTMAGAVYGIGQLVKGLSEHARRLDERLGLVERQPMPARGFTQVARPMAKSFGAYGTEQQSAGEQLSKSQVCSALTYMNLQKGIREINGRPTSELVSLYEGGGQLAPQTLNAVKRFLATHPSEAEAALSER